MALKRFAGKRFDEDTNNLINRVKVMNLKFLILNLLMNKIEVNVYMLHPTVKNRISTNIGGDNIVIENRC